MYILIMGTRPEAIKFSPILRILQKDNIEHKTIFSGQHYTYEMFEKIIEDLELKKPEINIKLKDGCEGEKTGTMITEISKILKQNKNAKVMVLGDVNTTLAGAMAAKLEKLKLIHIESGYRSFDMSMPEEVTRIVVDHCSDILFAASEAGYKNLLKENIPKNRIKFVGNTLVDACSQNLEIAIKKSRVLEEYNVPSKFALLTLHRQKNVDDPKKLKEILDGLSKIEIKIVFPIHPRTKKNLGIFKYKLPENIIELPPIGYLDFLLLESRAHVILTDSGGIQQEALCLNKPCVTLRDNTEYVESVTSGKNILAFTKDEIIKTVNKVINDKEFRNKIVKSKNPYIETNVAEKIIDVLERDY